MKKSLIFAILLLNCSVSQPVSKLSSLQVQKNPAKVCNNICIKLQDIGCPEGIPTSETEDCSMSCENRTSYFENLNLQCLQNIKSCTQIDLCNK